jgi:hypothetical protein
MDTQQGLIDYIAQQIGLQGAKLDENNQVTIAFGESVVVTFLAESDGTLTAVSYVADYQSDAEKIGKQLLQYNYLPSFLGGGKLSIDPSENTIVLTRSWDTSITTNELIFSELEAYVNAIAAIRIELEKDDAAEGPSPENSPMPNSLMSYGQMA